MLEDMTTWVALVGVLAAVIAGASKLVSDGLARPRARKAAAGERGTAYEEFIAAAIAVVAKMHQVMQLAPRLGFLPPSRYCRAALEEANATTAQLNRVSARLRRLAPDDVAKKADEVLKLVEEASVLMASGRRTGWDDLWVRLRDARVLFERHARVDSTKKHRRAA